MREALIEALSAFAGAGSARDGAAALLGALGYRSARTEDLGGVEGLIGLSGAGGGLTERRRGLFESWRSAEIVFQVTGEEIGGRPDLFRDFDRGRAKSFLFLAVELDDRPWSRTELAEATRAVNRLFAMPAILLFRRSAALTLAVVHRRAHRRDDGRDVLERVTLVKDVRAADPHRAHLDVLADLALPRLIEAGVRDFDGLHAAWERTLDVEALNRRFYRELFEWFRRAAAECRFPDDGAGEGSTERHVIRLITRLLFVWFMKEKGLIPEALFEEGFACRALKGHAPERTDYYRAALQNLFFATLNTEIGERAFSGRTPGGHRDFARYRYRDLLADPDGFVDGLKKVPFVNGGLFDCLDDFEGVGQGGRRIDAFTDVEAQGRGLSVPARLFLDEGEGLFPLFRRYKFTVEENTPLDREVALDPELLGRAFENLLAAYNPETRETARKATGSYYTPRAVVDYMVREALAEALAANSEPADSDAGWWRDRLLYLLDWESAKADAGDFFEPEEAESLVRAIAGLRVLDPAAGSGAFPMGVLQTLTLALRRLDPDNALWEAFQKERAKARAGAAFDAGDRDAREAELREINDTFERYRQSDFGRKLYLIQNGVYGVDVQPIACQIAKLRFFVSLAIEQEPDPEAPNLGIRPLPNLETRFAAADALIGLGAGRQGVLRSDAVKALEGELRRVRESYFNAGARDAKRRLRAEDERLRAELARELEGPDFGPDAARAVAAWDPYDQNARAGWFDPEWMFGVTDGFDVVIGNPPYVQLQRDGGRAGRKYRGAGYETFAATGDVYQLFYERGCGLLGPGAGVLAYITSNSWLKAESGRPLRRWLAERHTPLRLIEMGRDVFDAIVDAAVLLVREGGGAARAPAVDMDRLDGGTFPPPEEAWSEARPDGAAPWSILSAAEWRALDKMNAAGAPLRDWDVRINMGIKTGCNEAFVIDAAARDALVAEDPRSAEILEPVLRGRDVRRWRARWAGKWLIDAHNGYGDAPAVDVAGYPAVKRHLDRFLPALERRRDKGRTPYNLRSCAYHEDFAEEKLFWMHMTPVGRFAFSGRDMFCNQKAFMVTGPSLKYLCAVLNSAVIGWMVRNTAVTTGMGLIQWDKFLVESLPIPEVSKARQRPFVRLVDDILAARDADPDADVAAQEEEIDRLVYALYGLSDAEIAAVGRGP